MEKYVVQKFFGYNVNKEFVEWQDFRDFPTMREALESMSAYYPMRVRVVNRDTGEFIYSRLLQCGSCGKKIDVATCCFQGDTVLCNTCWEVFEKEYSEWLEKQDEYPS